MRKILLIASVLTILIVIIIQSCQIDEECYEQGEVPIVNFSLVDSIPVDSTVNIDITYLVYNNCTKLADVQGEFTKDTIKLHVIAEIVGCDCPGQIPDSTATYSFTPEIPKTYYVKAFVVDKVTYADSIVIKTLVVYNTDF